MPIWLGLLISAIYAGIALGMVATGEAWIAVLSSALSGVFAGMMIGAWAWGLQKPIDRAVAWRRARDAKHWTPW